MASALTIRAIKDGNGVLFGQLVVDQSGNGSGPFFPLACFVDREGNPITSDNPLHVGGGQVTTATAVIASGASLSGGVDFGTGRLCGLIMPSGWTSADITFQGSADGVNYSDLWDLSIERSIGATYAVANRMIAWPVADWLMVRALKLRSGSAAVPVAQAAVRNIKLILAN